MRKPVYPMCEQHRRNNIIPLLATVLIGRKPEDRFSRDVAQLFCSQSWLFH